jgi:phospholipase C
MPTPITRLVVLMLENRSFDHMLGFLKKTNPAINGLNGDEWNYPAGEAAANIVVSDDAGDVEDLNPDPNHEFAHVTWQISSTGDPVGNPDMKGFVRDYFSDCKDAVHAAGIMKCFTPQTLPILSTLATQYAVCDRWFSSVPGSTIPNRLFVHGASSAGSLTQDVIAAPRSLYTPSLRASTTPRPTTSQSTPQAPPSFSPTNTLSRTWASFTPTRISSSTPPAAIFPHTPSSSPPMTTTAREHSPTASTPTFLSIEAKNLFAKSTYALTKSPDWKSTLFLILYDEHGGIFDHVSPPVVTRNPIYNNLPDVQHSGPPDVFDFTRLGCPGSRGLRLPVHPAQHGDQRPEL